jgi:hypothetical protein
MPPIDGNDLTTTTGTGPNSLDKFEFDIDLPEFMLDAKTQRDFNLIALRAEKALRSQFRSDLLGFLDMDQYLKQRTHIPGTQPEDNELDAFYPVAPPGTDIEPYPHWVYRWRMRHPEKMFED